MRLLSRICKVHNIIPTSYVLPSELIRVGTVRYRGGFADVSDGEYLECPVAIKRLRMNEGDSDRTFKVPAVDLVFFRCSFNSGVMSRDYLLETFVPSEYPTFSRSFCGYGPTLFQHSYRVDAWRERDALLEVQSKGKPFAIGETARCCLPFSFHHRRFLALSSHVRCGLPSRTQDCSWRSQRCKFGVCNSHST